MTTEAERQQYRERQARVSARRQAEGQVRLAIWIPGSTHRHNVEEANRLGISLRDLAIRKLNRKA